MKPQQPIPLLGHGVYSFSDAAKYTGLKQSRIREWFRIRENGQALFESDYGNVTEQKLVSFRDLIEVFIAGKMRENGIPLAYIRAIHSRLQTKWSDPHPFCQQELRISGKDVFLIGVDAKGRDQIMQVLTGQHVFPKIISPFLNKLDYDGEIAIRWRIAKGVEINPAFAWGQPVASTSKIPTYILSSSFHANGKQADAVAHWFGVTKDDVLAAVKFEKMLVA